MNGAIVCNRYYTDDGTEYACKRLIQEAGERGIRLETVSKIDYYYGKDGKYVFQDGFNYDFVIFWDKDIRLAKAIESKGIRLFNTSSAIRKCDDKELTFASVSGYDIPTPITISNPLIYTGQECDEKEFLEFVESKLNYPFVVKENLGSQGKQVYLVSNKQELKTLRRKLVHIPHVYQELVLTSCGKDIRVYCIGGKSVASALRESAVDFRANVEQGGVIEPIKVDKTYIKYAERISQILGLDYAAIDFLIGQDGPILIEANSNAYFMGIEKSGKANIAEEYIKHIAKVMKIEK